MLGGLLALAGLAMLVLPGQGLVTLGLSLALISFSGKHQPIQHIDCHPHVYPAINRLRAKAGKAPLEAPSKNMWEMRRLPADGYLVGLVADRTSDFAEVGSVGVAVREIGTGCLGGQLGVAAVALEAPLIGGAVVQHRQLLAVAAGAGDELLRVVLAM